MLFGHETLNGRTGHQAGRELLEKLWHRRSADPMPPIVIAPGGKPYFAGSALQFSITHTRSHVFCVLGQVPVGIDAEELTRRVRPELSRKILSAGEYARYLQAPDRNRALLTFWVLKEAAVKCTGQGLRGYPNETDFSLADPRVREHSGCLVAVIQQTV